MHNTFLAAEPLMEWVIVFLVTQRQAAHSQRPTKLLWSLDVAFLQELITFVRVKRG